MNDGLFQSFRPFKSFNASQSYQDLNDLYKKRIVLFSEIVKMTGLKVPLYEIKCTFFKYIKNMKVEM